MAEGTLPPPPISGLMEFTMVQADPGRVVFTCRPDESAYNPIGSIHGGLVCTLLDSVLGCALHSTLAQGKGYTSIEIKVNYLKAVRLDQRSTHGDGHRGQSGIARRLHRGRRDRRGGRRGGDRVEHPAGVRPVSVMFPLVSDL